MADTLKPGNILIYRDEKFGVHRWWEVLGVFAAGRGRETLVELRSITEGNGYKGEQQIHTTFVPECLTRHLEVRESYDSETAEEHRLLLARKG